MEIPDAFKLPELRFVLITAQSKAPCEKEWSTKNNYSFDDVKLINHLNAGGNYGVLTGTPLRNGKLVILDIDDLNILPKLEEILPDTLTVETGSGNRHFYFVVNSETEKIIFTKDSHHYGELQSTGQQCVCPESIHPKTLLKYKIINDKPIADLTTTKIEWLKSQYTDINKNIIVTSPDWDKYKSLDISRELRIDSLIDFTGWKRSRDEFYGAHPIHGSNTGMNFFVNTSRNLWHCFRDNCGGDSLSYLAMKEGIINCGEKLKGKKFIDTIKIANSKYGFKLTQDDIGKIFGKDIFDPSKDIDPLQVQLNKEIEIKLLWEKELKDYKENEALWLIDKFIRKRGVMVLGGKRSTCKSWIALNFATCASTGTDFLGKFKCEKGNVLYIDRENSFPELRLRIGMLKKGADTNGNLDILFISESDLRMDRESDIIKLEEIIKKNNISLIICDVYRRLVSFDENDATKVSFFFSHMLKPLIDKTGTSFILIHHERKGTSEGDEMDMLRGSSDLANYVDSIFQIERRGKSIVFKNTKNRSGGRELMPFKVDTETDDNSYYKLIYKGEIETTANSVGKFITNWIILKNLEKFTYTEATGYCKQNNIGRNSVNDALKELVNVGFLSKGNGLRDPYIVLEKFRSENE